MIKYLFLILVSLFLCCLHPSFMQNKTDIHGYPCVKIKDMKTYIDSCDREYEVIDMVMNRNNDPEDAIDNLKKEAYKKCGEAILIIKQEKIKSDGGLLSTSLISNTEEVIYTAKIIRFKSH